jgi:hypothetical protein
MSEEGVRTMALFKKVKELQTGLTDLQVMEVASKWVETFRIVFLIEHVSGIWPDLDSLQG